LISQHGDGTVFEQLSITILVGGFLLLAVYMGISLSNLRVGLILSIIFAYNPLYSYYYLFTQVFQGGRERVMISGITGLILFSICLIKTSQRKANTSDNTQLMLFYMTAWLVFPLVGTIYGFTLTEYSIDEIGAELVPLLEFVLYFYVASRIIKHPRDARIVALSLALWAGTVAAIEVFQYATADALFALRVSISGGGLVSRLTDFMLPMLLPVGIAFSFFSQNRLQRWLAVIASLFMAIAVWISFFRTIWVSTLGGVVLAVFIILTRRAKTRNVAPMLVRGGLVGTVLLILLIVFIQSGSSVLDSISVGSVFYRFDANLLRGAEASSLAGRFDFVRDIVAGSLAAPWGQGMGVPFYSNRWGGWLRISDSPVFYLKILYQLGVIPFLFYVLLFVSVLREVFKAYHRTLSYKDGHISAAIIGGLFGTCLSLSVFPALLHFPIGPCTAVLLVCVLTVGKPENNRVGPLVPRIPWRPVPLEPPRAGVLSGRGVVGHTRVP
jgi:uncharacterized membrane protein